MTLDKEDLEPIKARMSEWLGGQSVGPPAAVYEIELREPSVRVEEELKHQRELMQEGCGAADRQALRAGGPAPRRPGEPHGPLHALVVPHHPDRRRADGGGDQGSALRRAPGMRLNASMADLAPLLPDRFCPMPEVTPNRSPRRSPAREGKAQGEGFQTEKGRGRLNARPVSAATMTPRPLDGSPR